MIEVPKAHSVNKQDNRRTRKEEEAWSEHAHTAARKLRRSVYSEPHANSTV